MAPTIWDVARLAQVSKSTVSRVLNGDPGVAPETARRVLEAAKALRYRPNHIARSLVKRQTRTLGLVIPDQRNPFYALASWAAEHEAYGRGYSVIVGNTDNDPSKETSYLQLLDARLVDGMLLIGGVQDASAIVRHASSSTTPMVLVDRDVGPAFSIPAVTLDNIAGGREMTEFLLNLGHRRIAFVTSEYTAAERDRRIGYEQALQAAGLPADPALIIRLEEDAWKAGRLEPLEALLLQEGRPTAIFASNDLKALFVYRLANRLGLRIPDDLSVVGYDDIEVADLLQPPLTTMAQPIEAMARTGTRTLIHLIEGTQPEESQLRFTAELRVRASAAAV
ncbi:MAG TPA: LacI family DNA-binding transcriptional regulator [Limnochorda sp.]